MCSGLPSLIGQWLAASEDTRFLGYSGVLWGPEEGGALLQAGTREWLPRCGVAGLPDLVPGHDGQRPREPLFQPHDDQWGGARQRVRHQGLGDAV